jgi:small ligand-binding sensory domain FIST
MQWLNAISQRPSLEAAVKEVTDRIQQSLVGRADLGIVFISSAYASEYPRLIPLILERLPVDCIIGCGGGGVIGMTADDRVVEIENNPALSLTVANLPEVEIQSFHVLEADLPDLDSPPAAWIDLVGIPPSKQPHFILLAEPFAAKVNDLLQGLDFTYAGSLKIGGLASSAAATSNHGLFYYDRRRQNIDRLHYQGTVGVGLSGNIIVDSIVAQGCRPIGSPLQVIESDRNVILSLAKLGSNEHQSPLVMLRNLIDDLSQTDRELVQNSLFIGIARDEFTLNLQHGDFLIRNLLGVEPRSGAMAIGDRIRPGQRIQFHLRDAKSSAEDLQILLEEYQKRSFDSSTAGALLFSCLGRGEQLYNQPNFDSQLFQTYLNLIPIGGFFGNGEIGPVGGSTFLHGYTSAFAIFRSKQETNC